MPDSIYVLDLQVIGAMLVTVNDFSGRDSIVVSGVYDKTVEISLGWASLSGKATSAGAAYFGHDGLWHRLVVNGLVEDACGSNGQDNIFGNEFANWLCGDQAATGPGGDDTLHGGDGDDTVSGGAGDDRMFGDADNDQLFGNNGADTIIGGAGDDTVTGGAGADVFVFVNQYLYDTATGIGPHVVTDFNAAEDALLMDFTAEGTAQASFDDFMANARQAGTDVVYVNPSDGWRIRLLDVDLGDLTLANFLADESPETYYQG